MGIKTNLGVKMITTSRLQTIWSGMKNRCNKPRATGYEYYGAKGISVCSEWESSFKTFEEWALKNGYDDTLSIDRKNSFENYEPANCRWSDSHTQQANKKISIKNTTGYIGVHVARNKTYYYALRTKAKRISKYGFKTSKEAAIGRNEFIIDNSLDHSLNKIKP